MYFKTVFWWTLIWNLIPVAQKSHYELCNFRQITNHFYRKSQFNLRNDVCILQQDVILLYHPVLSCPQINNPNKKRILLNGVMLLIIFFKWSSWLKFTFYVSKTSHSKHKINIRKRDEERFHDLLSLKGWYVGNQ